MLNPAGGDAAANLKGWIEVALIANATTDAQRTAVILDLSADQLVPGSTTQVKHARSSSTGTATEDSTGALTIRRYCTI